MDQLIERADGGITDDSLLSIKNKDINKLQFNNDFTAEIGKPKVTSQKLKSEETTNGTVIDTYVGFGYVDLAIKLNKSNLKLANDIEDIELDPTLGARLWIKIYYTHSDADRNGIHYELFDIIKTESSLTRLDGTYTLVSLYFSTFYQSYYYNDSNATTWLGSRWSSDERTVNSPSSGSIYTLNNTDSYWYDVYPDAMYITAYCSGTLRRGTDTWSFPLQIDIN